MIESADSLPQYAADSSTRCVPAHLVEQLVEALVAIADIRAHGLRQRIKGIEQCGGNLTTQFLLNDSM